MDRLRWVSGCSVCFDLKQRPAPDPVKRGFKADAANLLWVADMTYVPTWAGFIHLAIALDVSSRCVVGWSIGERMTADPVLAALNMAPQQRRRPAGVVHHSDQGSQYTSLAFGNRCTEMGVRPSMGSIGDACDNAMAASQGQPRAEGRTPLEFPVCRPSRFSRALDRDSK